MKYDIILWDFNGTIVEDVNLGIKCINTMLSKRNLPLLETYDAYREALRFPIIDYYRYIGLDFEKEPYEDLAHEWVKLYNMWESECPPVDGIKEALEILKKAEIPQMILSASEESMIYRTLDRFGLTEMFDRILGQDNIYASGKTHTAMAIASELRVKIPAFVLR